MTLGKLDTDRNTYTVEGAICCHERKRQLTGGEERTGFPETGKLLEQEGKGAREKAGPAPPSDTGTSLPSFWATGSNVTSRLKPELGLDPQKNAWPARCSTVTPAPHPVRHGGGGHPDADLPSPSPQTSRRNRSFRVRSKASHVSVWDADAE